MREDLISPRSRFMRSLSWREIRSSLIELELGISGALNVTGKMEGLALSLQLGQVFASWEKLAYPSLKKLAPWFADLLLRVHQLAEWTKILALLPSLWISGFFNAMAFMMAIMQVTARSNQLPLDFMTNRCCFSNLRDVGDIGKQPAEGVYLHGLFMEGAGWEEGKGEEEGYITDSKMKDLHPVLSTSKRGADYVFQANVRMDPDDFEFRMDPDD